VEEGDGRWWWEYGVEARALWPISWPVIVTYVAQYTADLLTLSAVGHGGVGAREKLASAALGQLYANAVGAAVMTGLAGGVDTLGSQAVGAQNFARVGVVAQRGIVVMLSVGAALIPLWLSAEPILSALGQDPAVAAGASAYVRGRIPGLLCMAVLEVEKRFLLVQNLTLPALANSFVQMALQGGGAWLTVRAWVREETDVSSVFWVSLTASAAQFVAALNLALYIAWMERRRRAGRDPHPPSWPPFRWSHVSHWADWKEFLRLGVPGALQVGVEWASFEVQGLFAGRLGTAQLDAHAVIALGTNATFMVPLGLAVASSVRVGQHVGEEHPLQAQRTGIVSVALAFAWHLLTIFAFLFGREPWAYAFAADPEVVRYVVQTMPVLILFACFDAQQVVLAGIARGLGLQAYAAAVNFLCYSIIGIAVGFLLSQPEGLHIGLLGVWLGLSVAAFSSTVGIATFLRFADWYKIAKEARRRALHQVDADQRAAQGETEDEQLPKLQQTEEQPQVAVTA
jgi:multidrug resistance protein, MATE family